VIRCLAEAFSVRDARPRVMPESVEQEVRSS
jgi:hypothetical protein